MSATHFLFCTPVPMLCRLTQISAILISSSKSLFSLTPVWFIFLILWFYFFVWSWIDPVFAPITIKRLMPLRNSSFTKEGPVINKQTYYVLPIDITQRSSCHLSKNPDFFSRGKNTTTCFLWALCLDAVPDIFNLLGSRSIQTLSRLQKM